VRSPRFNIKFMSNASRVLDIAPSTANNIKAWDKNLNDKAVVKHPKLLNLLF
jgi:hypothetical protein